MPVVAVQMVSGPDESRFYRRILAAIGAPEPPRATLSILESLALRLLAELRPGMLVIDEIHSLQAGTIREQARFLNMLRFLGNELRVPLVCVGTAQARNALRTDDQLVRRFEAFALPPWAEGDDFTGLMSTLGSMIIPRARLQSSDDQSDERRQYLRRVNGEHENIFDAIVGQDPDAARAAMRTHLANSRERRRRAQAEAS